MKNVSYPLLSLPTYVALKHANDGTDLKDSVTSRWQPLIQLNKVKTALDISVLSFTDNGMHLADERLINIFTYLQLSPATQIGKQRYEVLHVPDTDNNIYQHDDAYIDANLKPDTEFKLGLRTLSAIMKYSRRLRDLATPLLYHAYQGQGVTDAHSLFQSLIARPELVAYVKETALDYWNAIDWGARLDVATPGRLTSR